MDGGSWGSRLGDRKDLIYGIRIIKNEAQLHVIEEWRVQRELPVCRSVIM